VGRPKAEMENRNEPTRARQEKLTVYIGVGTAKAVWVVVKTAKATRAIASWSWASLWLTFGSLGRSQETQSGKDCEEGGLDHDPVERGELKETGLQGSRRFYKWMFV
jgi:hypothetical protein